jgi:hypothetical protein
MGFFNFIVRMVLRLVRLIWRQVKNQIRESFRSMSNPNNFFAYSNGGCSSGGGDSLPLNQALEEEKLWERYIEQQKKQIEPTLLTPNRSRDFSYAWGVLSDAKVLLYLEPSPTKEKKENKDFRWDYFLMYLNRVSSISSLEKEEWELGSNLSLFTAIALIIDIKDFVVIIGEEICKGIAFINHWKFLREELYSLLNLVVESNPISAYVTHACELSSLNNEHPKLSISEESIEVAIPSGHVENLGMRKQYEMSIAAVPINFE